MSDMWEALAGTGDKKSGGPGPATNRERMLERTLEEAKEKLVEQDELIRTIAQSGMVYAVVAALPTRPDEKGILQDFVLIIAGGTLLELPYPKMIKRGTIRIGNVIRAFPDKGIYGIVNAEDYPGETATVKRLIDAQHVEIDFHGHARVVVHGLDVQPEEGDKVLVDPSGSVVMRTMPKDEKAHTLSGETNVSWSDIGGLEAAKKAMVEAIELPIKHAALYKAYNKKPVKGVLLYGAPGCGKTLLAKAAATSISNTHNGKGRDTNFIYVKGPELLNKWVGTTEESIRGLFKRARDHKKKHGYAAIIFIDEADALLGMRGEHHTSILSSTVVPQFLSEMDGIEDSGALVLLSTNRPDSLDPAVVRDGRINFKVRVTRPTADEAAQIFKIHFRGVPLADGVTEEAAISWAVGALYAEVLAFYQFARKSGGTSYFSLANLVNGAMIAEIVDRATSKALHRDIEQNTSGSGVALQDLTEVITHLYMSNYDLNHTEAVKDFCEGWEDDIASRARAPRLQTVS